MLKRRLALAAGTLLIGIVILYAVSYLLPLNLLSIQQKPEQQPQKLYDYYIIYDEETGKDLMYVPLVVSVDDEIITDENKRYKVVKVIENRAYARFVENISLEEYQKKLDKQ